MLRRGTSPDVTLCDPNLVIQWVIDGELLCAVRLETPVRGSIWQTKGATHI